MEFIAQLWLPIVLSAAIVFIASSILWMATPLHKKDYLPPPDEEAITRALREHRFAPGKYFIPWCGGEGGKDMKSPEYQAKLKSGPWAQFTVMSAPPSFGRCLGQWFALQVALAFFIAYAAAAALPTGAGAPAYLKVFQVVGAIALLAHAGGAAIESIWHGAAWRRTAVCIFDGVVYALLTAGTFAWLWPRAIPA